MVDLRPFQRGAARHDLDGRMGLIDPDLPPIPTPSGRVFSNAYAAALAAPACLVRLDAADPDPFFNARLRLDPAIADRAPDAPVPGSALARYWQAPARAAMPGRAWAVLTLDADAPLCRELRARGAEAFAPTPFPLLSPTYRPVVIVLANTKPHAALLHLLHRYGGDVVLEDACLLAAYDDAQAIHLAERELGRAVPELEVRQWRDGIVRPPALLLGEVAAAASRLFVFSEALAGEIRARYGREAIVLPAPTAGPRIRVDAAGLWAEACVWAAATLAEWGVPVRLDVRLDVPHGGRAALAALADRLGVCLSAGIPALAVVAAMRGEAAAHAAALEAAAAGLPIVVSRSVAEAVSVPAVAILPDQPSPPLLAEAILAALPPRRSGAAAAAEMICQALGR